MPHLELTCPIPFRISPSRSEFSYNVPTLAFCLALCPPILPILIMLFFIPFQQFLSCSGPFPLVRLYSTLFQLALSHSDLLHLILICSVVSRLDPSHSEMQYSIPKCLDPLQIIQPDLTCPNLFQRAPYRSDLPYIVSKGPIVFRLTPALFDFFHPGHPVPTYPHLFRINPARFDLPQPVLTSPILFHTVLSHSAHFRLASPVQPCANPF